jgi:hypothetical protein
MSVTNPISLVDDDVPGEPAVGKVEGGAAYLSFADQDVRETLALMLLELRKMNMQLAELTGNEIRNSDL